MILEPSSGGNGIKLNTPNPMLIEIADAKTNLTIFPTFDSKNSILANLTRAP